MGAVELSDRRRFLQTSLAGVLVASRSAEAQQAGKVWRIGQLFEQAEVQPVLTKLDEGLRELGYVEGRNLVVERRMAAFKYDRLPELGFLQLPPEALFRSANDASHLSRATGV